MKNILLFCSVICLGFVISSCEKESVPYNDNDQLTGDGTPSISYVRLTNPESADSLLAGAFLGNLVAIIGENLQQTSQVWFNDQQSTINPALVTQKSILVSVPSQVPSEVNDKITLVFTNGDTLLYDFSINIPAPVINAIKSEYVPAGGIAVLTGDFFFSPEVEFTGGVAGEIVEFSKRELKVKVPEGAEVGPITVKTNFGAVKSKFIFRDDRNVIVNFDDRQCETWTAAYSDVEALPGVQQVSGIYGYFRSDDHGAWVWDNPMTMQYWAPRGRGNVPHAKGNIQDLVFKMEVNVPIPWTDVRMEIFPAPFGESEGRGDDRSGIFRWAPFEDGPYMTDGWVTIEIPLTEFVHNTADDNPTRPLSNLNEVPNFTMMSFGPADAQVPVHIAFDNLRIVPKS